MIKNIPIEQLHKMNAYYNEHNYQNHIVVLPGPGSKPNKIYNLVTMEELRNLYFKELTVAENDINRQQIFNLSLNTNLRRLYLGTNLVTDDDAIILARNKSLRQLDLSSNIITDEGAIALAKNKTLRLLNLNRNNITNAALNAFARNTTLQQLNLSGNKITREKSIVLTEQNDTLQWLDLFYGYQDDTIVMLEMAMLFNRI